MQLYTKSQKWFENKVSSKNEASIKCIKVKKNAKNK